MRPSKIAQFLCQWSRDPRDMTVSELQAMFAGLFPDKKFGPYFRKAIEIGAVGTGDGKTYSLRRREAIIRDVGFTMDRYSRVSEALLGTMRDNIAHPVHIERTALVTGLSPEDVHAFRLVAKKVLSKALVELDDWLVAHEVRDGIPTGVSAFQFDDLGLEPADEL